MALVTIPAALRIAQESWALSDNRIVQRSEFTGRGRELELGPAARWTCESEIVTMTAAELLPVRAFLGAMAQPGAWCQVPAYPGAGQAIPAGSAISGQVRLGGQLGRSLNIDGLTAGQTNALAGQMVAIDLANAGAVVTSRHLSVLLADVVANGSGQATIQLANPLRTSPPDNFGVYLYQPTALMRLPNALRFMNRLAMLHELPPLMFEENF
jgi:hypothetical protein